MSDYEDKELLSMQEPKYSVNKTKVLLIVLASLVIFCAVAGVLISITVFGYNRDSTSEDESSPRPNVIFMISDGFSPVSETFARTMSGKDKLELDTIIVGTSRTYSSMSWITDSAAGATAYACGLKTYNGAIAVNDDVIAQATAMEAAKKLGMTTAIVTTSRITHATPASFSSHMSDRDYEEEIALQQATLQSVDLLFGGGQRVYLNRTDGRNLLEEMSERGYQTITTYQEFLDALHLPVIGLFAEGHMDYEIDRIRQIPTTQPSLTQMVEKALTILTENNNPFFLMIEGARIDMSAHNHDAYTHYLEIMQYQDAVEVVKLFVDCEKPDTYVVSVADHATGGISIGKGFDNGTYPSPYMWYPDKLRTQTASVEWMAEQIELSDSDPYDGVLNTLNSTVQQYCGITLTDQEYTFIMEEFEITDNPSRGLRTAIGTVMGGRALVGWTTPGHTGVDVNLYAYGKRAANFGGVMQNIDVGNTIWKELGFIDTMNEITNSLKNMTFPPGHASKLKKVYADHD